MTTDSVATFHLCKLHDFEEELADKRCQSHPCSNKMQICFPSDPYLFLLDLS